MLSVCQEQSLESLNAEENYKTVSVLPSTGRNAMILHHSCLRHYVMTTPEIQKGNVVII